MIRRSMMLSVSLVWLPGAVSLPTALPAQGSVARAILFYSPTCPHCHTVIQEDLPGIFAAVGSEPRFYQGSAGHVLVNQSLALLLVNTTEPAGRELYDRVTQAFAIPAERQGVPRLLCGDSVLVGSLEIPERFPGIIRRGLAAGGIPWPAIGGLVEVFPPGYDPGFGSPLGVAARDSATVRRDSGGRPRADSASGAAPAQPSAVVRDSAARAAQPGRATPRDADSARAPAAAVPAPPQPESIAVGGAGPPAAPAPTSAVPPNALGAGQGMVLLQTLQVDPIGTVAALALIVAMLASLIWIGVRVPAWGAPATRAAVPLLVLAGVAIAAYLTYVETTGATAVCGPVGDCNAVQHSPYARLLGVVPVALLGLVWYLGILAAWATARAGRGRTGDWAAVVAFLLALSGTAGSVVLTVLEPFVIGAVCAWCLASAAVMTALLWLLAGTGLAAARTVRWRSA